MSKAINPFLYSSHPYRDNPFDVLEIKEPAKATPSLIQYYAKMVEEFAAQNLPRPSGRKDDKGEGGRAATALSCLSALAERITRSPPRS